MRLLLRLALTLPADEPRAKRCLEQLTLAILAADEAAAVAEGEAAAKGATAGESAGEAACAATGEAARGAACIGVPLSVLRALCGFRVLGPHLRATSRFASLQRCVDAALHARRTV